MQDHPGWGPPVRPVPHKSRRALHVVVATLSALVLVVLAAIPAGAMTITFIRHAESQGNASGYIDTKVPGPELTELGWQEADALPGKLVDYGYNLADFDGFYASTMTRTQQAAQPLLAALDRSDDDLVIIGTFDSETAAEHRPQSPAGIQEIGGGIFEGSSQEDGLGRLGYGLVPMAWSLGLRFLRIPGSEDGNEFAARMAAAIAQMEAGGDANGDGETNVVAFSHGGTMMFWTMMTVDNPDLLLMVQSPLENTDVVVVDKNEDGSYTLKSWAGQEVGEAKYPTQMFVNVRDLVVAPQTALYNLRQPVFALDAQAIGQTTIQGVRDVGDAGVKFVRNSVTDTVDAIRDLVRPNGFGSSKPALVQTDSGTTALATAETSATVENSAVDEAAATDKAAADSLTTTARDTRELTNEAKPTRSELRALVSGKSSASKELSSTGKSEPGKTRGVVRDRVRSAIGEASENVTKSVKDTRDAVRKAVTGKDAAKTAPKKDRNESSGSGSNSTGSSTDKSAA